MANGDSQHDGDRRGAPADPIADSATAVRPGSDHVDRVADGEPGHVDHPADSGSHGSQVGSLQAELDREFSTPIIQLVPEDHTHFNEDFSFARAIVSREIELLPEPMRSHMRLIPVAIYRFPPADHVALGARDDHAGAFFSPIANVLDDEESVSAGLIALYLDRIHPLNDEEIAKTYLHEAGHALGLDEEQVEALGLARNEHA